MSLAGAMNYEYLVRRAYQVGRFGTKGANADIYRRLEQSHGHFQSETELVRLGQPKAWNKPLSELKAEYEKNLYQIVDYVDDALAEALSRFSHSFDLDQRNSLLALRRRLLEPTFEELEAVIDEAQTVMVAAKIFPK